MVANGTLKITASQQGALKDMRFIADCELEPVELQDLVVSGKISVVLVILTSKSFQSASQLLRLALLHKHADQVRFKAIPLAIGDSFSFPGLEVLKDIEAGTILPVHLDREAESTKYTSEAVTFPQAMQALKDTMKCRTSLINVPVETGIRLRSLLTQVLLRIVHARDNPDFGTAMNKVTLDLAGMSKQ